MIHKRLFIWLIFKSIPDGGPNPKGGGGKPYGGAIGGLGGKCISAGNIGGGMNPGGGAPPKGGGPWGGSPGIGGKGGPPGPNLLGPIISSPTFWK